MFSIFVLLFYFQPPLFPQKFLEFLSVLEKKLPASCLRKQFYRNKAPQT